MGNIARTMQKINICLALFATFLVVNGQNDKQNGLGCATSKNSEENPSKPCILPFKYNGKKYNGCIKKDDENNKRWCATEVDNRGNFVKVVRDIVKEAVHIIKN